MVNLTKYNYTNDAPDITKYHREKMFKYSPSVIFNDEFCYNIGPYNGIFFWPEHFIAPEIE